MNRLSNDEILAELNNIMGWHFNKSYSERDSRMCIRQVVILDRAFGTTVSDKMGMIKYNGFNETPFQSPEVSFHHANGKLLGFTENLKEVSKIRDPLYRLLNYSETQTLDQERLERERTANGNPPVPSEQNHTGKDSDETLSVIKKCIEDLHNILQRNKK